MKFSQSVKAKDVARYMILPGIIPRLKEFGRTGFTDLAFLMASIYASVRLLPPNHPYLMPSNKGRFGMRNVIGEAYSRLVFKKENIDQILIFFCLALGFTLLVLQFVFMAATLIVKPAFAALPVFTGIFMTPDNTLGVPSDDVALMLLDSIFGVPGVFTTYPSDTGTCIALGPNCGPTSPAWTAFPTPFQTGLQFLFYYYNLAILLIACLVFLYYLLVVVAETAQTGTPFGKRFNHIWAPIRLVVALGLLVPINYHYNSAQYIVMYAAKLGSGFATNGWLLFNDTLIANMGGAGGPNLIGDPLTTLPSVTLIGPDGTKVIMAPPAASYSNVLIARPQTPDVAPVVEFMSLVMACKVAYETKFVPGAKDVNNRGGMTDPMVDIEPYLVKDPSTATQIITGVGAPSWQNALTFYDNHDIVIRFGHDGRITANGGPDGIDAADMYPNETGGVKPFCGEITISTKDVDPNDVPGPNGAAIAEKGYYDWVVGMFFDPAYTDFGLRAGCLHLTPQPNFANFPGAGAMANCQSIAFGAKDNYKKLPPDDWKITRLQFEWGKVNTFVDQAYKDTLTITNFTVTPEIRNRGWGGAGIWYNQIAQWNGALFSIVESIPSPDLMPDVMEKVQNARKSDELLNADERFEPNIHQPKGNGQSIAFDMGGADEMIARDSNDIYKYFTVAKSTTAADGTAQGNVVFDIMRFILGTDGIFSIRANDGVNPLAQLVAVGKSILDAALRNLMATFAFSFGGSMFQAMQMPAMAGLSSAMTPWASAFATFGLSIGFTLYYVLPFMPFIYFYFAVGSWVKAIFEAMVGVPLWAMAHLKIDGNGLPGDSALPGYFLIFEIFVRPILTVFGLLASIVIFSAVVRTLNGIFPLVSSNVSGYDCSKCAFAGTMNYDNKRNIVDEFFFTVMYTVLVYLIGTSCFKLIDQIPLGIMRWMGASAQPFSGGGDPGQEFAGIASHGADQGAGVLTSGAQALGGVTGTAFGKLLNTEMKQAAPAGGVKVTPPPAATAPAAPTAKPSKP